MERSDVFEEVRKMGQEHRENDDDERFFLEVFLISGKTIKGLWCGFYQPNIGSGVGSEGVIIRTARKNRIILNESIKKMKYLSPFGVVKYLK